MNFFAMLFGMLWPLALPFILMDSSARQAAKKRRLEEELAYERYQKDHPDDEY